MKTRPPPSEPREEAIFPSSELNAATYKGPAHGKPSNQMPASSLNPPNTSQVRRWAMRLARTLLQDECALSLALLSKEIDEEMSHRQK